MSAVGECSICLEPLLPGQQRSSMDGSCTHSFHWACIERQIAVNPTCPNCRAPITAVWLVLPDGPAARYAVRGARADFAAATGFGTVLQVRAQFGAKRGKRIAYMLPNGSQLQVPAPRNLEPGQCFTVQMPPELQSPLQPWPDGQWYPCSHCATSLFLPKGLRNFTCTQCGRQCSYSKWSWGNLRTTLADMVDDHL
mmetsp:Transcript_156624/g.480529  ORF Transcript_156624/g.480529 Transcript_156624/m.480529 type:complete len:196 (-) Transcript_156624:27-614(-)